MEKLNGRARFVVDADECIGCCLCQDRAPNNIEVSPDDLFACIFQQPDNDADEAACLEAAETCPTGGLRAGESEDVIP
jgi:ferredoxin